MLDLVPWQSARWSVGIKTDDALGPIELGLEVDESAARNKYFLFSAVIEVPRDVSLTRESLAQIARQGYRAARSRRKELVREYERLSKTKVKKPGQALPTVLSVMYAGSKLFISSSIKRSPAAFLIATQKTRKQAMIQVIPPPPGCEPWDPFIVTALKGSELLDDEHMFDNEENILDKEHVLHKNRGNCGEMASLHLWSLCRTSRLDDLDSSLMVSVWFDGEVGDVVIKRPCFPDGCERTLEHIQLEYVQELMIPDHDFDISSLGMKSHYTILPPPGYDPRGQGWDETGLYHAPVDRPFRRGRASSGPLEIPQGTAKTLIRSDSDMSTTLPHEDDAFYPSETRHDDLYNDGEPYDAALNQYWR